MTMLDREGHITEEGFTMLVQEQADEIQRLEASEHLSFCDRCLEEYLKTLERMTLLEPEESMAKKSVYRMKYRIGRLAQKHFGTAVAAACLAMVLWGNGVFSWTFELQKHLNVSRLEWQWEKFQEEHQTILEKVSKKYQQSWKDLERREGIPYGEK